MLKRWFVFFALALAVIDNSSWAESKASKENSPPVANQGVVTQFEIKNLDRAADSPPLQVGDQLSLTVIGLNIRPEHLEDSEGEDHLRQEGWQIVSTHELSQSHFKVAVLKSGTVTLPALKLIDESGKTIGETLPFSIQVASAISSDSNGSPAAQGMGSGIQQQQQQKQMEPQPLPPVGLKFPSWILIPAALGLVLLIVAGLLLIRKLRGKKQIPTVIEKPKPPEFEEVIALEALANLKRESLQEKGEFKKLYFSISEIFKTYLGARYYFDALESTSKEIINYLESRNKFSDASMLRTLEKDFEQLDLVKFTDHVPLSGEGAQLIDSVEQIILKTRRTRVSLTEKSAGSEKRGMS